MRVYYDGRLITSGPSGVRDIGVGLANGLRSLHEAGEIELTVTSDKYAADYPMKVLPGKGFMHWSLPRAAERDRADLVLVPRQTRPIYSSVPSRALIHDIGFFRMPEIYQSELGIRLTTRAVLKDSRLLAVSEFTKREIEGYGSPAAVTALPIGAQREMSWRPSEARRPYLLCVGIQHRHKNLAHLVEAWSRARTGAFELIICAKPGNDGGDLGRAVANSSKPASISVVDSLSNAEYDLLLSGAHAYVQPSLYEGLCVPFLNMCAAGVPSIGSSTGNVGVVLEGAVDGQGFDPTSLDATVHSLEAILSDETFRESASSWGRARVRVTDWVQVARDAL